MPTMVTCKTRKYPSLKTHSHRKLLFRNDLGRKNPRAHKHKIGTCPSPPQKKKQKFPPPPPKKRGILWAWRFSPAERTQKIPGAQKIGAAIYGPRISGGQFYGHGAFLTRGLQLQFSGVSEWNAEKCWEVLRTIPPLFVTPLPLCSRDCFGHFLDGRLSGDSFQFGMPARRAGDSC